MPFTYLVVQMPYDLVQLFMLASSYLSWLHHLHFHPCAINSLPTWFDLDLDVLHFFPSAIYY